MTKAKRAGAVMLVLITAGIAAARLPVSAHTPDDSEMLAALLLEIKGLRAAMEQMASSGSQAHIVVGRLQVQEHRVTSLIERFDTVHNSLEGARAELEGARNELQTFERSDMSAVLSQTDKDTQISTWKARIATVKGRVDQLAAEEAQLGIDVAAEQQRWLEINQRLDDLERALGRR